MDCNSLPGISVPLFIPPTFYAAPPQPGLNYLNNGVPAYLAQGTLVKTDDGQAIYAVWDQQFHPFQSWQSYLDHGGQPDLSNVVRWPTLSGFALSYFGAPVPL